MAKKRIIDPDFFIDEKIAKLDYKTRLLYIGLWVLADDYGVLEYESEKIKVQLFPYTKSSIQKNIEKLIKIGRLQEYEVDGKKYLWIKNFLKYQWLSHPTQKFPHTPEISSQIQKLLENSRNFQTILGNRIEKNRIEKNIYKYINNNINNKKK